MVSIISVLARYFRKVTANPSSPKIGEVWFNGTNDALYVRGNSSNQNISPGGAPVQSVASKQGDVTLVYTDITTFQTGVSANTDVIAALAHKTSAGIDHSDVVSNNSHRGSVGTDHSDVVSNNSYRSVGHIALSQKGAANGVATLDVDSKIPTAQLPALAITDTFAAANETEQLALTIQKGDVCVRSDENKSYINSTGNNTSMSDWQELLTPTDTVLSVAGKVGAVTLVYTDITNFQTGVSANSDVIAALAHKTSAGTDHSDVVSNNSHRLSTSDPHNVQHSQLGGVTATQHHSNSNDPTTNEKGALAGEGTPSASNKLITKSYGDANYAGGGLWEHIMTVNSSGTNVQNITGLTLDDYDVVKIFIVQKSDASQAGGDDIRLRINNDSSVNYRFGMDHGAMGNYDNFIIMWTGEGAQGNMAEVTIRPKTNGVHRGINSQEQGYYYNNLVTGAWGNTVTEITSLYFYTDNSKKSFGVGTKFIIVGIPSTI